MFSIDNITNGNGWAMAAVGAVTVFLGLVVLSFVISQIHKILEFWENWAKTRNANQERARKEDSQKDKAPAHQQLRLPTAAELCSIYRPLVEQLKEPFQLVQLYEKTKEMDLPHPHLSIKCLQEADVLVAKGDGTFIWDKHKAN